MKVYCPNCGASEEVAASRPGSSAKCRSCGASFLVRVRLDADTSRSVAPLYMWFIRKGDGSLISFPGAEQLYRAVVSGLVDKSDELSADGRTWAPVTSMPVLAKLIAERLIPVRDAAMPSEVRRALTPQQELSDEEEEPTRNDTVSWGPLTVAPEPAAPPQKPAVAQTDNTLTAPYPTVPQSPAASPSQVRAMLEELQQKATLGAKEAVDSTVQAASLRTESQSLKSWQTPTRPDIPVVPMPAAAPAPPSPPPPSGTRPAILPPTPPKPTPPKPTPPEPAQPKPTSAESVPPKQPLPPQPPARVQAPSPAPAAATASRQELDDLSPLSGADLGDGDWDRIEPSSPGNKEGSGEVDVWAHQAAIRRRNRLLGALGALAALLLLLVLVKVFMGGPKSDEAAKEVAAGQEPGASAGSQGTQGAAKGPLVESDELASPDKDDATPANTAQADSVQTPAQADSAQSPAQADAKPANTAGTDAEPVNTVEKKPESPKPTRQANPEFRPLKVPVDAPSGIPTAPSAVALPSAPSVQPKTPPASPATPVQVVHKSAQTASAATAQPEKAPVAKAPVAKAPTAKQQAVKPAAEKAPTPKTPAPKTPASKPAVEKAPVEKVVAKAPVEPASEAGSDSADRLRDAGRYAEAAELYERQLKGGSSAGLHLKLADCYRKLDNCAKALPHFEKAIAMGKSKSAYVGAARCYNSVGDPDKAAALLKEGLKLYDDKVMRTLLKQYGGE